MVLWGSLGRPDNLLIEEIFDDRVDFFPILEWDPPGRLSLRWCCTGVDVVLYNACTPNRLACPGKKLVKGRKRLFEIFALLSGDVIR